MFSRIFQFFTNSTSLFSLVSVKDEVITVHYRSEKDEPSVRNILKTLKQNNTACRGSRYQGLSSLSGVHNITMPHADKLAEQHLPHLHLRACALVKEPDLHAFANSLPAEALSHEESARMLEKFGEYYRNHEPELMRQMELHQRQIRRLNIRERVTETLNMGVQSFVISFTVRSLRDILISLKVPVKDVDFALNALLYLLITANCEGNYTNLAIYFLLEKLIDRTFDSKIANIIKFSFAVGLECHNLISAKSSVQGLINLATNTFFAYAGAKISRFLTTIYNPAIEEMDRVEPPQTTRVLLLVHN